MKLSEYFVENNIANITVSYSADEVNSSFNMAFKNLIQKINIPGFRKGFAPYEMFKNFVNKERFEEEAINNLLSDGVKYLFEIKKDVDFIDFPKIDNIDKPVENQEFLIKLKAEIYPAIELPDLNGSKIDVPFDLSVDLIENEKINSILEANATYIDKEEDVKLGDYCIVEHSIASKSGAKGKSETSMVELGKEQIYPDTDKIIMSMKKGEEKTIELDLKNDEKVMLNLKIIGFKEKILPVLSQELLDNLNVKKDLLQFTNDIKNDASIELEKQKKEAGINAIINNILEKSKIDNIPPGLLESYIDSEMDYFERELNKSGITYDDFLKRTNSTVESIKKEFTPKAELKLKFDLILREIIGKNPDINPQESEVKSKTEQIMGKIKNRDNDEEVEKYIRHNLAKEKAIEFLQSKFILNYIKEENK